MTIHKIAQQNLFKVLAKTEITIVQSPEYNGFGIDDFGYFQNQLNLDFENFEKELNDNLTNQVQGFELYLIDICDSLSSINNHVQNFRREEIFETQKDNPDAFKVNRLGYMDHFISFQINLIINTEIVLRKKLQLVKNKEIYKPIAASNDSPNEFPVLKNKIKSKLSKVNITVLLWWLAESEMLDFEKNHDNFVKFIEDNVQYFDSSKGIYTDMKHISSLMSKLSKSIETNPVHAREQLLKILQETTLPPSDSILNKNKWQKL